MKSSGNPDRTFRGDRDSRIPPFRVAALLALSLVALLVLFPLGCVETDGSGGATTTSPPGPAPEGDQTPNDGGSDTTAAEGTEEQARQVAAGIEASVVEIRAVVSSSALGQQFASGGGVVYRADGIIVTNNHVIVGGGEEALDELIVILSSGEELSAELVGREPGADVAVLRVDRQGLEPVTFISELSQVQEGQTVVAIGSRSLDDNVTIGSITRILQGVRSPTLEQLDALLQTDAPVQQGNSGGPLVDLKGQVVGIVLAETRGVQGGQEGLGMAIPAPTVVEVADSLLAAGQ